MYTFKAFNNFNELEATHPTLASELEKNVRNGSWKDETIYYYPDIEEYALYELTEGWYSGYGLSNDFNGAPDPIEHINLYTLGKSLANTWDPSGHYLTTNGSVLQTQYGW